MAVRGSPTPSFSSMYRIIIDTEGRAGSSSPKGGRFPAMYCHSYCAPWLRLQSEAKGHVPARTFRMRLIIRCCGEPARVQETKRGKGLGLFPEIAYEVAALKLLQPASRCPALGDPINTRAFLPGVGSFLARDRGGSLKRLHRPSRFRV